MNSLSPTTICLPLTLFRFFIIFIVNVFCSLAFILKKSIVGEPSMLLPAAALKGNSQKSAFYATFECDWSQEIMLFKEFNICPALIFSLNASERINWFQDWTELKLFSLCSRFDLPRRSAGSVEDMSQANGIFDTFNKLEMSPWTDIHYVQLQTPDRWSETMPHSFLFLPFLFPDHQPFDIIYRWWNAHLEVKQVNVKGYNKVYLGLTGVLLLQETCEQRTSQINGF